MAYWGHPDHDCPEAHLADRPFPPAPSLLPKRQLTRDELKRLEAALREIERKEK